ncbi:bifunctional 2-keto-4-hydroxyglutarate aldolase/2-keto-3-deoxy-6-phosphogluconate aldolase [Sporosarcina koreensis]|uniref:bifunctional 2-keto-4-hydroxyglutarate aldolase/2-keto-3-deoxy-6-phosphogluconate aldolase n=1 Tax=Sporosarcina koreensis TaxID=334735 RepID=UPI00075E5986|nr:bifunctional 2-keto-4-hydroxyglutarate aldolase/2-keto-3-deoxy-6-phosphogluconate aldolase [Sporosarcina koreensis]
MQRYHTLNKLIDSKLTVVIRGQSVEESEIICEACIAGGIKSLEVTFTIPNATQLLLELKKKHPDVLVGAGTVLDSETARTAIIAGAEFIVSPSFDKKVAKLCNRYGITYIPGCMTINEIVDALQYGVSLVKLFPADEYKPSFIKIVQGPLPHVLIMPTGGVNIDNVTDWLEAGAAVVGVGGEITRPIKENNREQITLNAQNFLTEIEGHRHG